MPTVERRPLAGPAHIFLDERGVAWIGRTNVKVVEAALDSTTLKMTPEQIHETYPDLSLAEIHAALAYYHDHKAALDAESTAREAKAKRLRASAANQLSRAERKARLQRRNAAHP